MGSMFRSELMTQCDVYLQPETAYDILAELGEMDIVQFNDMNTDLSVFQRNYVTEVIRCAEMERKLRVIEAEIRKDDIEIYEPSPVPRAPEVSEMVFYEGLIEKWEEEIVEITTNQIKLKKNYLELTEMLYVLTHIGPIVGNTTFYADTFPNVDRELGNTGRLFIITGVVKRAKCFSFEIMLWRISHGNIFYRQAAVDEILEDPHTGQEIRKVAFLAACQGEQLGNRMKKVCAGYRINLYNCPHSAQERDNMIEKLSDNLIDMEQIMVETRVLRYRTLKLVAKHWMTWKILIKKMKSIYYVMNLFNVDVTKKLLLGQCWVPTADLVVVRDILEKHSESSLNQLTSFLSRVETDQEPPTFFRTNKFTNGFQVLINAYGYATYREVNPGLYTIITFPFLFAIMFGDMGHALIMTLFATWMVRYEKSLQASASKSEVWGIFFSGRYVILLMGLFSIYTGFIYNDIFSKALNILGSHWQNVYDQGTLQLHEHFDLDPKEATTGTLYFLGMDPIWSLSKNKILFENSLKMKFSIIIGVVHMMFGVTLSVINYNYFKQRYSIILEFLPQILFLFMLFFYLVFMIFYKWYHYSAEFDDAKHHATCAPLVLILFIDMMLFSKTKPVSEECDAYMFDNQQQIQKILVLSALACIPVMLFGKPLFILYKIILKKREIARNKSSQFRKWIPRDKSEGHFKKPMEEDECFSEVMIHQSVHTIEFVLSTVSHTASYLRLWALSLAHGQLSDMLWKMILSKNGLRDFSILGSVKIVITFAIWAVFTISILVLMEGLSAFLHTLRLHWVEFMSKFYMGTGYPFRPFSFATILAADEKDDKILSKKRKK